MARSGRFTWSKCALKTTEPATVPGVRIPLPPPDLVRHNLKAVRATLLREAFEPFWTYVSVDWAGAFLDEWCVQVMRSQIEPMKKVARMLRRHRPCSSTGF